MKKYNFLKYQSIQKMLSIRIIPYATSIIKMHFDDDIPLMFIFLRENVSF